LGRSAAQVRDPVLTNFQRKHEYLIAIDSDGCAFDTMEIKHKECFIPNTVQYWDLQPISKYARAAAEFVNLYSRWRGINRWPALIKTFDLLAEWPSVARRQARIPEVRPLRDWVARETTLANNRLRALVEETGDPVFRQGLAWSEAVDATIAGMVHRIPPFPLVRESLKKISEWADILVSSVMPGEALAREWTEHGIAPYTTLIAGQELGGKAEHIRKACAGQYDRSRVLMIGDAPGDMQAARANDALFYPIQPGHEEASWQFFFTEAADKFRGGEYTADYEARLIAAFNALLPEVPPWMV
jgi:phosphoglycolate phosphatase-like HAD superfamily hydrolase